MDNRALWTVVGKLMFVKKVCVRLKCSLCFSDVKDGPPGFLCWNCGCRSTLQPSWAVRVVILSLVPCCIEVDWMDLYE